MSETFPAEPGIERAVGGGGRRRFGRAAAAFAGFVVAGVILAVTMGSGGATRAARDDGPALPSFSVETLSGETFSFPTGLPTAIYFTGSTCASCLPKAAVLDRIERESDGKLAVLGVDVDGFDTEEMFRDWIAHAGSPRHAFAMDRDFELLERFNVVALSTVVVADGTGRMVWRSADHADEGDLRRALAEAGLW